MRWQPYIVGLIDLLGQSRKLNELSLLWWNRYVADGAVDDKLESIHTLTIATYDEVEYLRELFPRTVEGLKKDALERTGNYHLTECQQDMLMRMTTSVCTFRSFSDMVVFCAPVDLSDGLVTRFRITAMLQACLSVLLLEFKAGTFFRGGIEIGIACELSNGDVYGPALSEAHRLEKEVAQYPRVVIGQRLSEFVRCKGHGSDSGTFRGLLLAGVNRLCEGLVCRDDDGTMIVDYLGKTASDLSRFKGSKASDFVRRGLSSIGDELDVAKKEGNEKLIERYEKLQAYYQSRMKFWDV